MPVIVGAGSSAFEASGSSIKFPTATANLSGINTAVGTAYYNTSNDELRVYTGATDGWKVASEPPPPGLGEAASNPASSAQAIRDAGTTTNGLYYINTPDGGTQQVYCMFTSGTSQGGDYGWMLVGRFSADAKNNVRSALASHSAMVDVTQSGSSMWSADFGTYTTTEVRVIGCSNTSDWMTNRSTDWIYQVPSNQNLIRFLTNQTDYTSTSKTAYGTVTSGPKQGMTCAGARDGRGRWTNSSYVHHRISDVAGSLENYCRPGHFSAAGSDMWHYNGMGDAKWNVGATGNDSGQDITSSALVGWDDNNGPAWFDANTGNVAQNATRVDNGWNHALFIFIR